MIQTLLVGYGRFGKVYARRLAEHRAYHLAGVVELGSMLDEIRAAELRGFTDLTEAIDTTHPRLVVIATPPEEHARLGTYALQRFCHVLMAKPGALGIDQAEQLSSIAWQRQRLLMVDYTPLMAEGWTQVQKAAAGRHILSAKFVRKGQHRHQPCSVLYDLAPHDVALALDLEPINFVTDIEAMGTFDDTQQSMSSAHIHLTHSSGRTTCIDVDWDSPTTERTVEITQPGRVIKWDQIADTIGVSHDQDPFMQPVNATTDAVTARLDHVARNLELQTSDDSQRLLDVTRILDMAEHSIYAATL